MRGCALVLALAAACATPAPDDWECSRQTSKLLLVPGKRMFDVLLLVDRSPSMTAALPAIADGVREAFRSGQTSVHLAVAATDLASDAAAGCERSTGGALIPPRPGCAGAASGAVIVDAVFADGTTVKNFPDTIDAALACVLPAAAGGCPIEQPLETLRRLAADGIAPGFLRPEATLVIAFLTDEDDCSLAPGQFLGPNNPDRPAEQWSRWRCFDEGVTCNEPSWTSGLKTGCVARAHAETEIDVDEVIAAVRALPTRGVRVFAPGAEPVVVGHDHGPDLVPVCAGGVDAWPAPRLATFAAAATTTPEPSDATACDGAGGASALYVLTAELLGATIPYTCIDDDIDLDATSAGVQASCTGELARDLAAPGEPVPACAEPPVAPCWRLAEDPINCAHSPHQLAVDLYRGPTAPVPGVLRLDCELPCEP
jgi:hypothetical protein